MEQEEGKLAHNPNGVMREIFSEFLAEVVKLEELVAVGRRFLVCFKQALEFLQRPSIHETSELVQSILKANETKRVKSYVHAGCVNLYDSAQNVTQMNTSLSGLQDYVVKAKGIIDQLEQLMEKAGTEVLDFGWGLDQDVSDPDIVEFGSRCSGNYDVADCASFMAVIYSMVKQDYVMQERIVSSLSLKTSSAELDSYCLMWSLRPYVNDNIIHQALRHVR